MQEEAVAYSKPVTIAKWIANAESGGSVDISHVTIATQEFPSGWRHY